MVLLEDWLGKENLYHNGEDCVLIIVLILFYKFTFYKRLFITECCDRTRGNGFKLEKSKFSLNIKKKFFTVRHWNRLPGEACECPLSGSIPGQAGWGCEQRGLKGGVPAYSRGVGTR